MSFKTVYAALFNQLLNYTTLRKYMSEDDFFLEFSQAFPVRNYIIFMEPGEEQVEISRGTKGLAMATYGIEVVGRTAVEKNRILGDRDFKGILEFTDDIKAGIRSDLTFGLNSQGTSVSTSASSGTYDLTANARYLTVLVNGNDVASYDMVDCGTSTSSGATIAATMQASLRALVDTSSKTGYADAVVSFDATLNRFTITSQEYGAISSVQVSEGAEKDASAILGFDNPTETRGKRIVSVEFGAISSVNEEYPIVYRTIPLTIAEEVYVY